MRAAHSTAESFELVRGRLRRVPLVATSVDAASSQLPSGAYTTFRTYDRLEVLRLNQHVARLEESAAMPGQPGRVDRAALRRALGEILARRSGDSKIRLTFAPPRLFMSVEPFEPLPHRFYEEGVRCATVGVHREDPHAKDTRFLATANAARGSLGVGIHEGLLLDVEGRILEGLSSNFFAVLDGTLRTEGDRVLKGVTRTLVLEMAAPVLPVGEQPVGLRDLPRIGEAFITSVSREILPVAEIDGIAIGDGRPGEITKCLMAGLADTIERESEDLTRGS